MSSQLDPFLQACHGTAPLRLEIRRASGATTEQEFAKPNVLVGRDSRADLCFVNPEVALKSLYFQMIGGRVFGVRVGETPVKLADGRTWEAGWVQPTDEFQVGWVRVRVVNANQRTPDTPPSAEDPLAPRHSGLLEYAFEPLQGRSNPPRRFVHRQDLLLVGREAPCRFLVRHPDVSRFHAALVHTSAGLWVVDLLSRTGVTVNDARVDAAPLKDGDRVMFGSIGVRICLDQRDPRRAALAARDPAFEQLAQFQQHTFDQFRELLGAMVQMVGGVLNDHRRFMREELDRLERIVSAAKPGDTPPPALPPTAPAALSESPTTNGSAPQSDRAQLQSWVSQQLDQMNRQRTEQWADMVEKLKNYSSGG